MNQDEPIFQYVNPNDLVEHEEAARIPEMSPDEWADFIESVKARGEITDPVFALKNGKVFDGRHRLRAAKEFGIRLIPVLFYNISEDEALQRMADAAVLRRSLSPGQRAAIILEFRELVDKVRAEAKERQKEAGELFGRGGKQEKLLPDLAKAIPAQTHTMLAVKQADKVLLPNLVKAHESQTHAILAEKAGIGKSSMRYLMSVQRDAPDLFQRVKAGEITINKAYFETKKRKQAAEASKVIPLPKRPSKRKAALDAIKRESETVEATPKIEGEGPLTEGNLLRYRAEHDFREYALRLAVDYDALLGADRESVRIYINRLKWVIEGGLLLIAEFDEDEKLREIADQIAEVMRGTRFLETKSTEGAK